MIYFIYGEDSYRAKGKLEEIVQGYKEVHKSGLNLIYLDAGRSDFKDFYSNLKITPMFAEKKLVILRNAFVDVKFQEEFSENIKSLEESKDIIVVFESGMPDQRTKFFKALLKSAKCQDFCCLKPQQLRKWIGEEFEKNGAKIDENALYLLVNFAGKDLWKMANEIKKLANYKRNSAVKIEDVELLIKPNIENDIFKTIDALASGDKKQALSLLHKHLENGDNALYMLSMIAYQFRNLLILKELQEAKNPYNMIAKKSGLHPFVVQKSLNMCSRFSMAQLKKIYQDIFQADSDIKTGKIEPELALDLLLSRI